MYKIEQPNELETSPRYIEMPQSEFDILTTETELSEKKKIMDRHGIKVGSGSLEIGVINGVNPTDFGRAVDKSHRFKISTDPHDFGSYKID